MTPRSSITPAFLSTPPPLRPRSNTPPPGPVMGGRRALEVSLSAGLVDVEAALEADPDGLVLALQWREEVICLCSVWPWQITAALMSLTTSSLKELSLSSLTQVDARRSIIFWAKLSFKGSSPITINIICMSNMRSAWFELVLCNHLRLRILALTIISASDAFGGTMKQWLPMSSSRPWVTLAFSSENFYSMKMPDFNRLFLKATWFWPRLNSFQVVLTTVHLLGIVCLAHT